MYPGQFDTNVDSVSYNQYAFSAHRLENGDGEILIDEKYNNIRGHYEVQATDSTGDLFVPNKNEAYYISAPGLYKIVVSSNFISLDGYVYMNVSLAPDDSNVINTKRYKLPVDYEQNILKPRLFKDYTDKEAQISASSYFTIFTANAKRLNNGDVQVDVNTVMSSALDFSLEHVATSMDSSILLPNKNNTVLILPAPTNNENVKSFIISKNNVAADEKSYIYFNVYLGILTGQNNPRKIKIQIK